MNHTICFQPIDITRGAGPLQDFLPVPDPAALAASAVALANTDGGVIVIGLDASGNYTGPLDGGAVARARREAAHFCTPPIDLDCYELVATRSGPGIAIHIERGTRVHALLDGRVMVRAGRKNRALNGDEIRQFVTERTIGEFEAEIVPGARPSDLDPYQISAFMVQDTIQCGPLAGCEADELLLHLGAITPDAGVTVAGMLLFGLAPQRWLPQCTARFVQYVDREGTQIGLDRAIGGPLARQIDELWQIIRQQMRTPARINGSDEYDYAPDAVREALVNAVCHRDYRLRDKHITVSLYPDRLEIVSPGSLPGFMTQKSMLTGRYSRNPRVTRCLSQWGYIPAPGSGLMTIILSMDGFSSRPPQIIDAPYSVTVRLFNDHTTTPAPTPATDQLNERQHAALAYTREHGSITMREFRTLYPTQPAAHLKNDLVELASNGHLRQIGARARAYYILP